MHKGLLGLYSDPFAAMCNLLSLENGDTGIVRLPTDSAYVFGCFHAWSYQGCRDNLNITLSTSDLLSLAVFADKYRIRRLFNAISDRIRQVIRHKAFNVTPAALRHLFESTVSSCRLRNLCVTGFLLRYPKRLPKEHESEWIELLKDTGAFGLLCYQQRSTSTTKIFNNASKCHWHDHSNFALGDSASNPAQCSFGNALGMLNNTEIRQIPTLSHFLLGRK